MSEHFVTVTLADPQSPEGLLLVQHLWEELGQLYGESGPSRFLPSELKGEGKAFVLARLDGEAVGCGAILPLLPGVAEVKRIFVEPSARRSGTARLILRELESVALKLGYTALRLETGIRQPAAIRLYESDGYQRIECYGKFAEDPLSVCFEKRIGEI
ncbi:MAG TPA: GNAT family N-acetyltransferase [Pyrinomonadaceae bacterium]